jgi:uncharacterized Zn finger protein
MEQIEFVVQGSEPEPYRVRFRRRNGQVFASCTCQASAAGIQCKHRLRLMRGDPQRIVSNNQDQVPHVVAWLVDTHLGAAFADYEAAEVRLAAAKKATRQAKDALIAAMHGRADASEHEELTTGWKGQ